MKVIKTVDFKSDCLKSNMHEIHFYFENIYSLVISYDSHHHHHFSSSFITAFYAFLLNLDIA